jgi:hypothetical protein
MFPGTVVEIETEDARADPEVLRAAQERTIQALREGKDVVFQATFFDEPDDSRIGFVGSAAEAHRPPPQVLLRAPIHSIVWSPR